MKWLPLNLTFRQISMYKMANYLRQRDLEESFGKRNETYEDAVRAKRIEGDFETNGFFDDYLGFIVIALILIKYALCSLGNYQSAKSRFDTIESIDSI